MADDLNYYLRGLWCFDMKKHFRSKKYFTKAIIHNYKKDESYIRRGIARYLIGDYQGCISDYFKAIDLNPNWDSSYDNGQKPKNSVDLNLIDQLVGFPTDLMLDHYRYSSRLPEINSESTPLQLRQVIENYYEEA